MKKEYGKNRWVKGLWIAVLVFFSMPFVTLPKDKQQASVFFGLILLLIIFKILQVFMAKIIISDDHVTVKKGVIFREVKDIKYKKINSVDITYAFGIGGIEIQIGNDKPIVFKNLESYEEVKTLIHEKIDEKE